MGRPKKNKDVETEIEEAAGLNIAAEEQKYAQATDAPVKEIAKNEMPNDYTLDVIADYDPGADIFRIPNKDQRYAYRFIKDDQKTLSIKTGQLLFQKGGWQLCDKNHCKRIGIKENFVSPDGFYHVGELILAFMPKELFDKKEAAKNKKTEMRTNQINRLLKDGDPSIGGKEMHRTMKGIQPGHKLGMSSKED